MENLQQFADYLHRRGISVTAFAEALREWEKLPAADREKIRRCEPAGKGKAQCQSKKSPPE